MIAGRELDRLAGILSRLESPFEGERAAAGLIASREVRRLGMTWRELIAPPQLPPPRAPPPATWRELARRCASDARMTDWERQFVGQLLSYRNAPSPRQQDVLDAIAVRLGL